MKRTALLFAGTGLAALAALPGHSQTSRDSALEAACRATEATMPDSCPCTITKARAAGLNDTELASLFKDDGHSQPVAQGKYSQFWQVKSQCIADTMMASLGVSQGNPLPGIPEHMRPKMPGIATPAPVPSQREEPVAMPPPAPPPSSTPAPPAPPPSDGRGVAKGWVAEAKALEEANANIAKLRGNAYEYTEEDGQTHRYDFLADRDIVIYQSFDPNASKPYQRFTTVSFLSAYEDRYRPKYAFRDVASGDWSSFSLLSVADDSFLFNKAYVRTAQEWRFRKVGPAKAEFPAGGPQPLEDGFWQVPFELKLDKKNPFFTQNFALADWTNAANREAFQARLASTRALIQIKYTGSEDCNHNCVMIVNDFDQRSRSVRGRIIEEVGVDAIAVRPEKSLNPLENRGAPNTVSLRAYDGYGGWKEWRCSNNKVRLGCSPTKAKKPPQARPAAATAGSGSLLAQLGMVKGETWGGAACSTDLYFFPENGTMPQGVNALFAHIRSQPNSHFATQVDVPGADKIGYKLKVDGKDVVLPPIKEGAISEYSNGALTLQLRNVGPSIGDPNEPSYGFQQVRAQIDMGGTSESFDAISLGAC